MQRALIFESTENAYNHIQCEDSIKSGDLILIPSEKVVGMADTWPIAVTKNNGSLHSVKESGWDKMALVFGLSALDNAAELVRTMGYEIDPNLKSFLLTTIRQHIERKG